MNPLIYNNTNLSQSIIEVTPSSPAKFKTPSQNNGIDKQKLLADLLKKGGDDG
jgi:hypothetical protein